MEHRAHELPSGLGRDSHHPGPRRKHDRDDHDAADRHRRGVGDLGRQLDRRGHRPQGVYAYQVSAVHHFTANPPNYCNDVAFSSMWTGASVSGFSWINFPHSASLALSASLGAEAAEVHRYLYKPNLGDGTIFFPADSQLSKLPRGAGICGQLQSGVPGGDRQLHIRSERQRDGCGRGKPPGRDPEVGATEGAPQPIIPSASSFYDGTEWHALMAAMYAAYKQGTCADGSHHSTSWRDGTKEDFLELARTSSLLMTVGHGQPDHILVGSEKPDDASVVDTFDITHPPDELTNLPVLVSLHLNCYAAGFAQAMHDHCGAACTIGWDAEGGSVPIFGSDIFADTFWDELCLQGNSVEEATLLAADQGFLCNPHLSWYKYDIYGALTGGGQIFPARWGR